MKKVLLSTAALAALVMVGTPAHADTTFEGTVGGYMKAYLGWANTDESSLPAPGDADTQDFDFVRDTELHFNFEGTTDNGLTFGAQIELEVDNGDGAGVDETYGYVSGSWGRVNFGSEDGAAYLLQVAAPSADTNLDGLRTFVNPFNYGQTDLAGHNLSNGLRTVAAHLSTEMDYDNDLTTGADKLTYLTPVFSGFQAGLSWTPDTDNFADVSNTFGGFNLDDQNNEFGQAWEIGGRWEGNFNNVGINVGGGYTTVDMENDVFGGVVFEDFDEWNVGLDLNIGAFGVGTAYTENNGGVSADGDEETWVVGVDYTTGPYVIGASYLDKEIEIGANDDIESDRWAGGVTYSYAPGITFSGTIQHVDHEITGAGVADEDTDGTSVLFGSIFRF